MKFVPTLLLFTLGTFLFAQDSNIVIDSAFESHASRYQFAPSGFGLKEGDLYFNTSYYLLYDLQYGISDQFSLGIGGPALPFFMYLTPKFSFSLDEKTHVAIGGLLGGQTIGKFLGYRFMLPYTMLTFGGPTQNFSLGYGYLTGYFEGSVFNSSFVIPFQAKRKSGQIVTEIWVLPNSRFSIVSPGFRLFDPDQNSFWGGGLAFSTFEGNSFPIPMVFRTILF